MSESNHEIGIASTFHVPVGFFQDTWDNYLEKGFKRYRWDCYSTLRKCEAGIDTYATKKDPKALVYCREKCPLTDKVKEFDEGGEFMGIKYEGCAGQARKSSGWASRQELIKAKKLNDRDTYRVEFECERPLFSGPVFGRNYIEASIVDDIEIDIKSPLIVGIDWGYQKEGAMIAAKDCGEFIAIIDAVHPSKMRIGEWIDVLEKWKRLGSEIIVYADGSHTFENRELEEYGVDTSRIYFQTMRTYLEYNLAKYFNFGKIKIYCKLEKLVDQLYKYRKNDYGKVVKDDDHGVDALEAALLHWDFMEKFGDLIKSSIVMEKREEIQEKTINVEYF